MNQDVPWFAGLNLDIQEFSAAGVRTFAVVEGRADAFPVILLHGLPGGAFIWASVVKALGRSRLSIAPDMPGWGRSYSRFAMAAPDLSVTGMRAWLNGLLVAQNVQRFDLVAHGDVAWPAMELLIAGPSRVRRLALISAPLWEGVARAGMIERLLGHARWSRARIARWLDENEISQERDLFLNALGQEAERRTAPLLSELGFPERIPDYRAALTAYNGAKLLIWGANDLLSPQLKVAELTATVGGTEVHCIANAGHLPLLDAPEVVAALLKDFLGE